MALNQPSGPCTSGRELFQAGFGTDLREPIRRMERPLTAYKGRPSPDDFVNKPEKRILYAKILSWLYAACG